MPINYDVEYPKLQRKFFDAQKRISALETVNRKQRECVAMLDTLLNNIAKALEHDDALTTLRIRDILKQREQNDE